MLACIYAITGLLYLQERLPTEELAAEEAPAMVVEEESQDEARELVERAQLYFDQGNLTAALESYEEAVAANPELAIAYARWGQLLTLRQRADEGLIRTERALALAPRDPEVLTAHSMALEWSGNYADAIWYAEQAIELDPSYAAARAVLSDAYIDTGRIDEALATAREAVEIDPDDVWAWRNLGWVYENLGRWEEAIEAYRKGIEVTPLSILHIQTGRNQRALQDYRGALESFREATVVDPRNPTGYAEAGFTHFLLEEYSPAVMWIEQGIEKDPTFGRNYALLGIIRYRQLNFESSIEAMEQAVSFGYSTEDVFYYLGLSYAYLDRCDEAVPWLQRALDINANSEPALAGMRQCGALEPEPEPVPEGEGEVVEEGGN
jgi:tetratricopeptide (TPR) repeat protein